MPLQKSAKAQLSRIRTDCGKGRGQVFGCFNVVKADNRNLFANGNMTVRERFVDGGCHSVVAADNGVQIRIFIEQLFNGASAVGVKLGKFHGALRYGKVVFGEDLLVCGETFTGIGIVQITGNHADVLPVFFFYQMPDTV